MEINYTGINHLAMATGDIDTTIVFWRDIPAQVIVLKSGSRSTIITVGSFSIRRLGQPRCL